MQWTVVAIAIGGGADGEGVSPSPVSNSQRSAHLISPTPPGLRPPHTHLTVLELLPFATFPAVVPCPEGRGQSWRYSVESRAPGAASAGRKPMPAHFFR